MKFQNFLPPSLEDLEPYDEILIEPEEHLFELKERFLQLLLVSTIILFLLLCSLNICSELILRLVPEIEFFQISPQDFLLDNILNLLNIAILTIYPSILKEILFFLDPAFLLKEKMYIYPLIAISTINFFLGILFGFTILAPVTFNFFIDYSSNIIQPSWAFGDFSKFLIRLIYITILLFQIPIIQIILFLAELVSLDFFLKKWKYILVGAFFISGILTPSTDPFTQTFLAFVICGLYTSGIFFSKLLYTNLNQKF